MMNSLSGFFSGFYRINDGLIAFNNIASGKDRRVVGLIIMRVDNIMLRFISAKVSSRACCPTAKIIFSASSVSSPEWRTWWKVTLFPLTATGVKPSIIDTPNACVLVNSFSLAGNSANSSRATQVTEGQPRILTYWRHPSLRRRRQ